MADKKSVDYALYVHTVYYQTLNGKNLTYNQSAGKSCKTRDLTESN